MYGQSTTSERRRKNQEKTSKKKRLDREDVLMMSPALVLLGSVWAHVPCLCRPASPRIAQQRERERGAGEAGVLVVPVWLKTLHAIYSYCSSL